MVNDLSFHPVPGLRLAAAAAGIRYRGRDDLVLVALPEGATASAVFTRNAFCAAPVVVAREHLGRAQPRYLLINSGNANAGTGASGLDACRETCRLTAAAGGVPVERVLPFSTGVIGEDLPVAPFARTLPRLFETLDENGWPDAARAIMTTDTVPKLVSRRVEIEGRWITVTGMAKGSGMICPDMATMLAFVATDAQVRPEVLDVMLRRAVAPSFNAITVDGDTSTNDACLLAATGVSGVRVDDSNSVLGRAIAEVCMVLAEAIVADGEGATKTVAVEVVEARDTAEARQVAYTVAHSPLVKTALFASDPNWGRILAAVGRAGVEGLEIGGVRIWLDDLCIVRDGGRDPAYTEAAGQRVVSRRRFTIRIALGRGSAEARILTCDLSFDYVRINAEYRT